MRDSIRKPKILNRSILVLVCLVFVIQHTNIFAAGSKLTRVRCHRYEEGGKPVKVRLSLDFSAKPERLNLVKSDTPLRGVRSGFVEDFIILALDPGASKVFHAAEAQYGNAKGTLDIRIEDDRIHVAIKQEWELQSSKFNYLDENKVAYIDMRIIKRKKMPQPEPVAKPKPAPKPKPKPKVEVSDTTSRPPPVKTLPKIEKKPAVISVPAKETPVAVAKKLAKPDTVFIEKFVFDTVYIEVGGKKETTPDTIYIEKIVYVEKGENINRVVMIRCMHYLHWWNDPHFRIDFRFCLEYEELILKKSRQRIKGMPKGYEVQFVVYPKDKKADDIFINCPVDYVHCTDMIAIMQIGNKCYVLAKEGYSFKPEKIEYDKKLRTASLRLNY